MKYPSLENEQLAEFVGILLGDGCLGMYKCKSGNKISIQHRVKISLDSRNEIKYASYIESLIRQLFKIKPQIKIRKNENTLDILIFKKDLLNFLLNEVDLKISPKRNKAKIPSFYLKNKFELFVLKGYFDTDGCIASVNNNGILYPRIEMKICKSPMQRQFIDILRRNNFRFESYKIENENIRIQLNGVKELKKWHNLIGFSNSKNIERCNNFLRKQE